MKARIVIGVVLLGSGAWAQPQPPATGPSPRDDRNPGLEREERIQRMERVLEEAVTRGIRVVEGQLTGPSGLVFFAGPVHVRGFDLEDYGVFFDVEYPAVRRSLLWSLRTLRGGDGGMSAAFEQLRSQMRAMPGPVGQDTLQMIAELESRLNGTPVSPVTTGGVGSAPGPAPPPDPWAMIDPLETYQTALRGELANALVSVATALGATGDEWVSVAARDTRGRIAPRLDGSRRTLHLRIRGEYLDALREGRATFDEVRQQVEER